MLTCFFRVANQIKFSVLFHLISRSDFKLSCHEMVEQLELCKVWMPQVDADDGSRTADGEWRMAE